MANKHSIMTREMVESFCNSYYIPDEVHPTAPGRDMTITQFSEGKVGVYTRLFDYCGYRIPLTKFFLAVLKYFRIHISQLSPFGAARVSHFEVLTCVLDLAPSVAVFRDLISCGTIAHAMVDGGIGPRVHNKLPVHPFGVGGFNETHLSLLSICENRKLICSNRLIENRSHEGDDHCVTHLTTFSSYSIKNDFLNNLPKVSTNDIRDIGKAMSCVVVATVKKIEHESDWWYLACVKCNHKANQDTVTEKDEYGVIVKKRIVFMCTNKACGQDTDVEYKQAHPIIDKSAAELLQEVRKKGDMDILPTDFNKLIEKTYAFKVDIKDFNIEKDKHTYGISQLTNDTDIINELIKKESDDQEIQSNSQSIALELVSQPASSFMSPPSRSKHAKDVLFVTGDNIASHDDEKSTATSPRKSKFLSVIDVDNDPLFSSTKKKLLSPKKEKEDE
ncbi:nucleic acid-binding, OB-fold, replication protein A, OB domain protein [Tanacetum coccineum]